MFTEKQIERMMGKLKRLERTLEPLLYQKVDELDMGICQTDGSYTKLPPEELFQEKANGTVFEGEGIYCWEKGMYTVPDKLAGKKLFIFPHTEAYEGLLFVDGVPYGNFAAKILAGSHGNHYCDMFCQSAQAGKTYELAIEHYANHEIRGTQPMMEDPAQSFRIVYHPADICVLDEGISGFYYRLRIANQMAEALDQDSFRRAEVVRTLKAVHEVIYYDPANVEEEAFRASIGEADAYLKEMLNHKNSDSAPYVGLIGHSHMDTAWLWHRGETEKKCARTYANQMSLMDQYPDYTFIQSSAYHTEIIRQKYPQLFEQMKEKIAEGRYEPNGGVWIECDCNIPSGEYMIRQFLLGQRYTRKYFHYTADSFWLPDTFGYSAALPQIMKASGIKYFLTTKMSWNDTNEFPYDTFIWEGIDGSRVLTHFNRSHLWPSPEEMVSSCAKSGRDSVKERTVSDMRLFSYGFGDGGGGPETGMIEMAEQLADVEGLPKTSHTTVSEFMQQLETRIQDPSVYAGELYLELHRGTLTNQHTIKRNNRKGEIALRSLEYFTVRHALYEGICASEEEVTPLMEEFLVNQFHDILPGTGIPRVHSEAIAAVHQIREQAEADQKQLLEAMEEGTGEAGADPITLLNTLSWERNDVQYLPYEGKGFSENYPQQTFTDMDGQEKLALAGVSIPAFSSVVLPVKEYKEKERKSVFSDETDGQGRVIKLETPYYQVSFNEKGYLEKLLDKRCHRQLVQEAHAFNTLLIGEEVSLGWDAWDIDADCECKLKDTAVLLESKLVSKGAVEYRIRNRYQLTAKTTMVQDVVFYADSPLIRFESCANWQDDHRFLKAAFDTDIHTDGVNQEIQFGYLRRSVHRNTAVEKAKFEVCNHKYTDMSETRYGIALLNDCKYGISVWEGSMHLSLHKGGCMPDYHGDKGIHRFSYGILPHMGGFSAANVTQPAYQFNLPAEIQKGSCVLPSLVSCSADNIIIETVKPMEDSQRAYLLRIYEAEGSRTEARLRFGHPVQSVVETNMLEEEVQTLEMDQQLELTWKAFEIKSLKVCY
ncbi:MAG: glycoside hydrolase family 38 C-terminal domain-containing protein [Lachnospiraceae bacterium]|nr:glycoside hydrolase family 38 C-terminal domain-containing protein [Lachnospiraceae bacterium]